MPTVYNPTVVSARIGWSWACWVQEVLLQVLGPHVGDMIRFGNPDLQHIEYGTSVGQQQDGPSPKQ